MGSNLTGSEKLPLLIIGTAQAPRQFTKAVQKRYEDTNLCLYKANESAWMNKQFFREYLEHLNNKFKNEDRKILLFFDGPQVHAVSPMPFNKTIC